MERGQHGRPLGHGQLAGRRRPRRLRRHGFRLLPSVMGGPRLAQQPTGPLGAGHRHQIGIGGVDHLADLPPVSALSESSSKNACAVPTTSNAALLLANSARSRSFSRRSRSASTSAGLRAGLRGLSANAACPAASRARRHSIRCDEYNPSRRSGAPFAPGSVRPSYSARIAALYPAVNDRRRGRSDLGPTTPAGQPLLARYLAAAPGQTDVSLQADEATAGLTRRAWHRYSVGNGRRRPPRPRLGPRSPSPRTATSRAPSPAAHPSRSTG
jgi:hypothetical protein